VTLHARLARSVGRGRGQECYTFIIFQYEEVLNVLLFASSQLPGECSAFGLSLVLRPSFDLYLESSLVVNGH